MESILIKTVCDPFRLAVLLLVCCSLMSWTPLLKLEEEMLEMEVEYHVV